jgi:hypothetical protein
MAFPLRSFVQFLSKVQVITRAEINEELVKDNVKIAQILQQLFVVNAYAKDIPNAPEEHAISVLNLTHYVRKIALLEAANHLGRYWITECPAAASQNTRSLCGMRTVSLTGLPVI